MRFAPLVASLLIALPASAQAVGQQAAPPAPPSITIVGGVGSPVALVLARLVDDDGTTSLECVLDNKTGDKVSRVDLLFLVYDPTGKRKTSEVFTLPDQDAPLGPRLNLTVRFPLPGVEIGEDDILRVGLTLVGAPTAADAWADDELGARSDREVETRASPPPLVVSNPVGAPIVISSAVVQADTNGGVHGVSLVATNAATVPAQGFTVIAHVFSPDGRLAASVSRTFGRPVGLLPRASYPVELILRGDGVSRGRVWVGLERIETPAWRNPKTLEQATAAMQPAGTKATRRYPRSSLLLTSCAGS